MGDVIGEVWYSGEVVVFFVIKGVKGGMFYLKFCVYRDNGVVNLILIVWLEEEEVLMCGNGEVVIVLVGMFLDMVLEVVIVMDIDGNLVVVNVLFLDLV